MRKLLIPRLNYWTGKVGKGRMYLMLAAFIIGCVFANEFDIFIYNKLLWVGVLVCIIFSPKYFWVVVFFCLGITRVYFVSYQANHISNYTDNTVELTATVGAYPYTKGMDKVLVLKPHKIVIIPSGENIKISGGLIQTKVSKFVDINKGDLITMEVMLEKPENFEEFDYVEYLKSNNIYATAKLSRVLKIDRTPHRFGSTINTFRSMIVTKINTNFPDPHAKLLAGMLIGTREQFSPMFANNLSISGTTHVVAVSGYNISLIINSIMSVAGFVHRKILVRISYAGLILFLLIVGIDNIPALRATMMGFALLTAMMQGRRSSGLLVLLFVALIMHLQNPFTYRSLSFQLSFAATFGLMLLSTHLTKITQKFIPKALNEDVATTLTAILVTFPVTFANFGKITTYALLANVLIAPLIPIISFSGIAWLLVSAFSESVGLLLRGFLWGCLEVLVRVINLIATFPYADLTYANNLSQLAVLVIIVIIVLLLEFNYREFKNKNA